MMNKALPFFVSLSLLCSIALVAAPFKVFRSAQGDEVRMYSIPQENEVQNWMNEIEQLEKHKILVEAVSPEYLTKYCELSIPSLGRMGSHDVDYIDVRGVENVAMLIRQEGATDAMNYLMGINELDAIYKKWGIALENIAPEKASKLAKYRDSFAATRQKCQQLIVQLNNAGDKASTREIEAVGTIMKRFCDCFVEHLFMHFGVTRKTLVAEHRAFLNEVEQYNDLPAIQDFVKQTIEEFKTNARWLTDTAADETVNCYLRRLELLSKEELQKLDELNKTEGGQLPETEEINLFLMRQMLTPLVAVRTVHLITQYKNVALILEDPILYAELVELLGKQGYEEQK